MKKAFLPLFLFVTALLFPLRADAATAKEWLNARGKALIAAVTEKDAARRYAATKKVILTSFREKEFARLALGRVKTLFEQRHLDRYNELFLDYLLAKYIAKPVPVTGVDFTIGEEMPSGKDTLIRVDLKATAEFTTLKKNGEIVTSDMQIESVFALRGTGTGWYIRDVQIEGKSMLMFIRKDIDSLYETVYNDPDELLASMERKIRNFKEDSNIVQ